MLTFVCRVIYHPILIADGDYGGVQALEITSKPRVMYNLTVAWTYTFGMGTPADRQNEPKLTLTP
jgi:hypothetical protein